MDNLLDAQRAPAGRISPLTVTTDGAVRIAMSKLDDRLGVIVET